MRGLLNDNIARFDSENPFGFPEIFPITEKIDCSRWIDFDTARRKLKPGAQRPRSDGTSGIHFYISDYKYNGVWEYPQRYISLFQRSDYIVAPDFSMYYDWPAALQIYNKYRNHWLAAFYSLYDIHMIPNIRVSTPSTYNWSFCGYPRQSVVAFSDIGSMSDPELRNIVYTAYEEMLYRLAPLQVLYFTRSNLCYAPTDSICTVIELPFVKGDV